MNAGPTGESGPLDGDTEPTWDFFVSYTDREPDVFWAKWIAWHLREEGYRVVLAAWDWPPGSNWVHNMDDAVQRSRHTIVVLSKAYVEHSRHGRVEWQGAYAADPSGAQRKLIPVRTEICTRPALLRQFKGFDLFGLDREAARQTLLEGCRATFSGVYPPPSEPPFPGAQPAPQPAGSQPPDDEPTFPLDEPSPGQAAPVLPPGPSPRSIPADVNTRGTSGRHSSPRVRRGYRRTRALLSGGAAALVLLLIVALGWGRDWIGGDTAACPPTELRVAVAPSIARALEDLPPDKSWVSRFENSRRGCDRVHLYVYPVEDLVMADAMAVSWGAPRAGDAAGDQESQTSFQTIGPEPDVWIPSSALAVERARELSSARVPATAALLGTAPLVALVPDAARQALPTPLTARALALALTSGGVSDRLALRRPALEDGSGLTALRALYRGLVGGPIDDEKVLEPYKLRLGLLETRTVATVCGRDDANAESSIVTLVPRNVVARGDCAGAGTQVASDRSFGQMDYSYVALKSPGEPSADRAKAAAALGTFLTGSGNADFRAQNGALAAPPDGPAPKSGGERISPVVDARQRFRPDVDLLLAVDVSDSMSASDPAFARASKAQVARRAIEGTARLARPGDRIGLWEFARGHRPVLPLSDAGTDEGRRRLLAALGRHRPKLPAGTLLYSTIADGVRTGFPTGAEARPTAARVLVLVTDGEDESGSAARAAAADARAALDGGRPTKVFLLSIGGGACTGEPSSGVAALGPRVGCLPVNSPAALSTAVDRLSAELWGL